MKNFAKSILNYFATYNETRFNFDKKIIYSWTNNELTLDINIFKEFTQQIFDQLKNNTNIFLTVKQGQYTISIDSDSFKNEIVSFFNDKYDSICQEHLKNIDKDSDNEKSALLKQEQLRKINLTIRKYVRDTIITLQQNIINDIKKETLTEQIPISPLNINLIEQKFYDFVNTLIQQDYDCKQIKSECIDFIRKEQMNLIVFDLYYQIETFKKYIGTDSVYLFLHDINYKKDSYPLIFLEIQIDSETKDTAQFIIRNPRDIILLNTSAINSFEFDRVLTLPRASSLKEFSNNALILESFLNSYYQFNSSILLGLGFHKLVGKDLPIISPRIGFQIVQKEERSILDYSELITMLENDNQNKFVNMITNYVESNVEDTTQEVHNEYLNQYPQKSERQIISDLPISLNNSQKKIVTAMNNPKNKIIVVDGPPGTGKSYTITALIYNAVKNNKSVVVTSHKKEALNVIEDKLSDQFKILHPNAKPSILRLTNEKEKTLNSIDITLSSNAINHASKRANDLNITAIKDDLRSIETKLKDQIYSYWSKSEDDKTDEYIKYLQILNKLSLKDIESIENTNLIMDKDLFFQIIDKLSNLNQNISVDELIDLIENIESLDDALKSCEILYKYSSKPTIDVKEINIVQVKEILEITKKLDNIYKSENKIYFIKSKYSLLVYKKIYKSIFKRGGKEILELLKLLKHKFESLGYKSLSKKIEEIIDCSIKELTIGQLINALELIKFSNEKTKIIKNLEPFASILKINIEDSEKLYQNINSLNESLDFTQRDNILKTLNIIITFKQWFCELGLDINNVKTIDKTQNLDDLFELILLYIKLPKSITQKPDLELVNDYNFNLQKLLEYENDRKYSDLLNFSGDISRIINAVSFGKRMTEEQSKVLLEHLSCVIAPAGLISKTFPMKEDIIDTLIIDEASQVSIADSISLILRAKQTIVFGDELQYGAVGAMNVSKEYSSQYFKDILDDYAKDKNDNIDDETKQKIIDDISKSTTEEDIESSHAYVISPTTKEWLKTFSVRTSTLSFCKAIKNYSDSLNVHFRSFPEIIGYSNEKFYKESQIPLIINRIRTKPITDVLQFIKVETKGLSGQNVNLDEIEVIKSEIEKLYLNKSKDTIGIICSFKEQTERMKEELRKYMKGYFDLIDKNKLAIWFVGDVQGEERDVVFYSFVEDKKIGNANLSTIYPVVGGTADNIRKLKKQRLNVGFSRAKDKMVFVHSMPIEDYSNTVLGEALKWYKNTLETANDNYIDDESVFGSPAEKDLYILLQNTEFYKLNKNNLKIIAQFPISKYIVDEYHKYLPNYRVDFLVTLTKDGKQKSLILEYDGLEYHFKDTNNVNKYNYSTQYLEYDIQRQLELESYGYKFLRLNKFNLMPENPEESKVDILNKLLISNFNE